MKEHCLSSRNRWLCCAIRIYADLPKKVFLPWPKQTELHLFTVRLPDLQHDKQLQPSSEAIRIASDPRFLKFSPTRATREETLKRRVYEPGSILPTFMAMYGRRHCLDESMFFKNGYLGFFVKDESCPKQFRFWHPAEICMIHGATDNVYLDEHYPVAWLHMGNSIGIPHALQLMIHALQILGLGDFSPFLVFQTFHSAKMTVEDHEMIRLDKGILLCTPKGIPDDVFIQNAKLLETCKKELKLPDQCWSPRFGFLPFDHLKVPEENQGHASQISNPDQSSPEILPTIAFQPVMKGFNLKVTVRPSGIRQISLPRL